MTNLSSRGLSGLSGCLPGGMAPPPLRRRAGRERAPRRYRAASGGWCAAPACGVLYHAWDRRKMTLFRIPSWSAENAVQERIRPRTAGLRCRRSTQTRRPCPRSAPRSRGRSSRNDHAGWRGSQRCGSTITVPTLPPRSTFLWAAAVSYNGKRAATDRIRAGEAVHAAISD